jgi:hypothetical protein
MHLQFCHQLAINAPIPTQEFCTFLQYSTTLFRAVTNPDPRIQRATENLCHLWNVPNLHPHQKTNDLAATVQSFQLVDIQAEEIKTSLLGGDQKTN